MAIRTPRVRSSPAAWAARLDVEALLVEYQAALDDGRFHDAAACFTDDGCLQFDDLAVTGPDAIEASMNRQLGVLDLTHHTLSNARVTLDDGPDGAEASTATLSAQVIGTHLWTEDGQSKQALQGGHYDATLRYLPVGWRMSVLAPTFLWTVGDPWHH